METSNKGLVFSIKRFAVHDGQGIRTTVFMKGCNLRCVWCHNPEGLSLKRKVIVSKQKCIYCKRCKTIDREAVMKDIDNHMEIENKENIDYQKYINICPTGAIQYDAKYYTIKKLKEEVLKDQVFFNHGGGITISGGEPLLQVDFVTLFLKECKSLGIHTAIETALHVPLSSLVKVLPYVDTLYCDIKEMDTSKHCQFTGVDTTLILDNIRYLLHSEHGSKVIIRTPLIPRYNATKRNLKSIASFIQEVNPDTIYELLNYNPLALSKYLDLKQPYCLDSSVSRYKETEMEEFRNIVKKIGLKNVI